MNPLDRIVLTGLRALAHHGVLEHERRDGQEFIVDATVQLQFDDAVRADAIGQTIHYGVLAEQIVAAVERDPVDLIETVAERVADVVLAYERAVFVTVEVHKPSAPITVPFDDVSVRISRGRRERLQAAAATRRAVIALGSNLGDREGTIRAAVHEIATLPQTAVVAASGLVQTPALKPDGVDRDAPAYLNAVVLVDTGLAPSQLLTLLHLIERAHGRVRDERWGDRTLDLDIIDVAGHRSDDAALTIPHPRAAERDFVLAPWLQVDPDATLTGVGRVDALLTSQPDAYPAEPLL
jgi:dihydroneopterin aldolase / 2-amino-4-hydroxy-6-hydroxymethyldihydropteridine diphosphokinase